MDSKSVSANEIASPLHDRVRWTPSVRSGGLWLGIAIVGMVAFFMSGWTSLLEAWSRPEYSHGYLILPIALYLLLTRLEDAPRRESDDAWWGVAVAIVALGLVVGLLGNLGGIPDVTTYGSIICAGGLVLAGAGVRSLRRLWVPVVYLVFMLPLPNIIYWPLSIRLQLISSEIGIWVISAFGIPVHLDGNIIDLGVYQLQVAEACSGLRYLFPLMSFGFLFAVLYQGPRWHKIVLFLSAAPITVFMNSFRIGAIGVLVDRYGIEQAEGFLHVFEGWIIFVACVAILYLEAVLLQRLVRKPRSIRSMIEFDPQRLLQRLGRIRDLTASKALIASAVIVVAAGIAWQFVPARAAVPIDRTPLALFPDDIGGWEGKRNTLPAITERVLGADDYLTADFERAGASPVNLLIAYYNSQATGGGIHSPEVCIPGSGWEVSRWTTVDTGLVSPGGQALSVNRAIIQKGLNRQLVYYWFEQRGTSFTSDYMAKGHAILDSALLGRTDGALIRTITPIAADESPEAADERLVEFLRLSLPVIPDYVPG
jgi:exosortase D (VPLPA-CTERM-specific)